MNMCPMLRTTALVAVMLGGCTLYGEGGAAPSPLEQCQALVFSSCNAIVACGGDCPAIYAEGCDRNQTVVPMATLTTAQRTLSAYACGDNGAEWSEPQGTILLDAMLSWPAE